MRETQKDCLDWREHFAGLAELTDYIKISLFLTVGDTIVKTRRFIFKVWKGEWLCYIRLGVLMF